MSSTESPAPKSRGRHRANKSTPHAHLATPPKPNFNNTQHTPRMVRDVVTPPQSPKAQQQSPQTASAKKNKKKSKPKPRDVNTDVHNSVHQGYDSPTFSSSNDESNAFPPSPTRGVLSTPTKAYAGPNFHSSPNPSSLPVPSWFSKSVPATPSAGTSLQAMLDLSEETLSQSLEEPESHLQKLFRADKEEKAKRASAMASMPTLATLVHGSPKTTRRQSPDSSDSSFPDVFGMDTEKKTPTYEMQPQALFSAPPQAPKVQTDIEARKQADKLKSFLSQPQMPPVGVEKGAERLVNQPTAPFTPAKRRASPPQHTSHSAPRAQFQTPAKKAIPQQAFHSDHNPHFIMTPPRGPKGHQTGYPQTPTPARDYHYNHPTYPSRNEIQNDSVLQLTEMEVYLRRVLNLENRAIATPAAAS